MRNKVAYNPDSAWNNPGDASQKYHKGATFEMRSKPVQGDHGNQCTYNVFANVITWIPAAGSADYQTGVWWNVYDHYWHDVHTFEKAKELNRIRDYFSVRPV